MGIDVLIVFIRILREPGVCGTEGKTRLKIG